ncbi:MAG TPA: VanW family protein [Arachnia sp.]|nr:VanW family protein [Arachnia sp.]HMT85191.1 VanW family protein [Arachnia sp.]
MSEATAQQTKGSKKKVILFSGIGLVVLLGVLYVAGYFVAGNRLPKDAAVDEVAIGGLSPAQAEEKLRAELGPVRDQPITIAGAEGVSSQILPADAGLSVDYAATLAQAGGGFSWDPATILDNLTGGDPDVEVVVVVDQPKLDAALQAKAPEFAVEPVAATLSIASGAVERTESELGVALDTAATATAVVDAFREGDAQAQAVVTTTEPEVTSAMVDEAVTGFAEPVLSGPIVLTAEGGSMTIPVEKIAAVASFEAKDGALVGSLATTELIKATAEEQRDLKLTGPREATYQFQDGKPVVVPSVTGQVIDSTAFAETVNTLVLGVGEAARTAAVTTITSEPEFNTEAATKVLPREVIGEFTTYYPHASYRNTNLGQAAKRVNGTVLMPGEIFSLDSALGPRTAANGYVDGYVIDGGRLVKQAGGGISQSATTLYNAAFFAGYEDIEHKPHSLYFDRYPAGREATIMSGSFDMRFRNDTEYPAIIQGYINKSSGSSRGSLTFKVWSIPTWDKVTATDTKKTGFFSGSTVTIPYGQKCEPQAPISGFTATYSRLFWKDGKVVKQQDYSWKYSAGNKIVCAPKPAPPATDSAEKPAE